LGNLSGGTKQKVNLVLTFMFDSPILILDEPTTGLDPNQLEEIRRLIREISREKTVILSSHIMQEVEAICNRVIIIDKGKIVADGGIDEVKTGSISRKQVVIAEFTPPPNRDKLLAIAGVKNVIAEGKCWKIESAVSNDIRPAIFRFAVENHLTLLTLREQQQNLESIFQQLTKK
ncbi:MAG: AAA family ATPase, partial [Prolixibacteraceae bacterium]|nr:AAA family ATPase [Prolixibacteraceae bacterium]